MNAVTKLNTPFQWSPNQLRVIKASCAKDTNDDEFSSFIEYCKAKGLDPFVRQAIIVVYNKDRADKRQATIITTQEGYRALAARCHDYRPAEQEPIFEYEEAHLDRLSAIRDARKISDKEQRKARLAEINEEFPVDPTNPEGISKCTITLWKQDPKTDQWHPVNGWARWRDYAPVREEWIYDQEAGKRKPTGRLALDPGNWSKMGHVMIAKCANSAGLRAGWPATFSGVYSEEEFDRTKVLDLTASEIVAEEEKDRRQKAVAMAKDELPFVSDQGELQFIPAGQFADRIIAMARQYTKVEDINNMMVRNREALKRFWASQKDDALEVKKQVEARIETLSKGSSA